MLQAASQLPPQFLPFPVTTADAESCQSAIAPLADIPVRGNVTVLFDWFDLTYLLPWKVQMGCLMAFVTGGVVLLILFR